MMNTLKRLSIAAAISVAAFSAAAQEAQLRLATAFPENTAWSQEIVKWSERVNAQGKGLVKITFIGGPRAVPTFEIGNAVKSGHAARRTGWIGIVRGCFNWASRRSACAFPSAAAADFTVS